MHWMNTDMLTESLKSWNQVHWRLHHLHTALRKTSHCSCWLQTVFCHWFCKFRSLHVLYRMWHWSTESMSRGSAKIYMHCTHTTAHSMTLSSTMTAWLKLGSRTWLKSLIKRLTESTLDWLELLTVSCVGEGSLNFSVCLFVCLFVCEFVMCFFLVCLFVCLFLSFFVGFLVSLLVS